MLTISAHWYIGATAVAGMTEPRTIHDFYGFPRELFEFRYSAPGTLATQPAAARQPIGIGLMAEKGSTFLVIYAPGDLESERAMNVVRRVPFDFVRRYHREAIPVLKQPGVDSG